MKSMKFSGLTIVAPRLPEQPRDVGAGEPAAEHERAASRVPGFYHRRRAGVGDRKRAEHEAQGRGGRAACSPNAAARSSPAGSERSWRRRRAARKRLAGPRSAFFPAETAPARTSGSTTPSSTGIGHARNFAVVASGDAVIAVGGQWGTLSEVAFADAGPSGRDSRARPGGRRRRPRGHARGGGRPRPRPPGASGLAARARRPCRAARSGCRTSEIWTHEGSPFRTGTRRASRRCPRPSPRTGRSRAR